MASRIVTELIFTGVLKTLDLIASGKTIPTIFGALLGGAAGTSSYMLMPELTIPGFVVGAIAGAALSAALFPTPPKPEKPFGARDTDTQPISMGSVLRLWTYQRGEITCCTALMERALYILGGDPARWEKILEQVSQGVNLHLGRLVRFDELERIEYRRSAETDLDLYYHVGPRSRTTNLYLASAEDREELFEGIQEQTGKLLVGVEGPMATHRAILAPAVVATLVALLLIGASYLSWYWIQNPPPPPRGKTKPDDLVALLTWAGPGGVLLAGILPIAAAVGWLAWRLVKRPRVVVLRFEKE
jgi:hypothetical protein